jgi:hypothetical protein
MRALPKSMHPEQIDEPANLAKREEFALVLDDSVGDSIDWAGGNSMSISGVLCCPADNS